MHTESLRRDMDVFSAHRASALDVFSAQRASALDVFSAQRASTPASCEAVSGASDQGSLQLS